MLSSSLTKTLIRLIYPELQNNFLAFITNKTYTLLDAQFLRGIAKTGSQVHHTSTDRQPEITSVCPLTHKHVRVFVLMEPVVYAE